MANIGMYTIIFALGGAYFTFVAIVAAVITVLLWLWRRRLYPSLFSTIQFFILAGAWWLMLLEYWPKQREDGREFPWYRDIALALALTIQTWIVAVALHVGVFDGAFCVFLTLGGGVALVLGNYTVYPQGWWGVGSYAAVLGVVQFMLLRGSRTGSWRAWAIYLSSLICVIGIPVVQVLSWTMMQAADKDPHRKISEILYLVVTAVGFTLNAVLASLFYSPHTHTCDVVMSLPQSSSVPQQQQEASPAASTQETAPVTASLQQTGASLQKTAVRRRMSHLATPQVSIVAPLSSS